jgi:hypothetical protein
MFQHYNPKPNVLPFARCGRFLAAVSLILLAAMRPAEVFGQTLKERLILTDTNDSVLLKAKSANFDTNGQYLFVIKEDDKYYFLSNSRTIGPLNYRSASSASRFTSFYDRDGMYYVGASPEAFGPIHGSDIASDRYSESENGQHLGVLSVLDPRIGVYIDGKLKTKVDTFTSSEIRVNSVKLPPFEAKKHSFEFADWIHFSNNGNCIFSMENDLLHRLYVNGSQIDSSPNEFYQSRINNAGDFVYAGGKRPLKPLKVGKREYDYMFFIHSADSILGPVRTVWQCDLKENGGYYYSGDDNGTDYIAINNTLYKDIESISNITILGRTKYMFTYKRNGARFINVNGNSYGIPFSEIHHAAADSNGNFACYGVKNYRLYKFINGVVQSNPITRYGVRAVPLYISPEGRSLHYFKTDDSTYLYEDEHLVLPAFSNSVTFSVQEQDDILPDVHNIRDKAGNGNNLFYIQVDTTGYFVLNGRLSRPMMAVAEKSYLPQANIGEVVLGKFDDNGFWVIQKIASDRFRININNEVYKELDGAQEVLKSNAYFDGKKMIFYAIKGMSYYQYTLRL